MAKELINTDSAPAAIGPYSQAVKFGNLVFTSGQIPLTPQGELVEERIEIQTKQVLSNLKAVLESAGTSLDKGCKNYSISKKYAGFCCI